MTLVTNGTSYLISGGDMDPGITSSVLHYQTNKIYNGPIYKTLMRYGRMFHACTIFKSPLHDKRPVAIVAGGCCSPKTAEILDFTQDGSTWQESKLISSLLLILFFLQIIYWITNSIEIF